VLQRQARPVHLDHRAGGVDDALQGREHVPGIRQARAQLSQAVGEGIPASQRVIALGHRWFTAPPRRVGRRSRATPAKRAYDHRCQADTADHVSSDAAATAHTSAVVAQAPPYDESTLPRARPPPARLGLAALGSQCLQIRAYGSRAAPAPGSSAPSILHGHSWAAARAGAAAANHAATDGSPCRSGCG
jgi:hypothetical protein